MITQIKKQMNRWPLLAGMMLLSFAVAATAADSTYVNNSVVSYNIPPQVMPTIDATNFINTNSFTINFTTTAQGQNIETFETEDTLNYTNTGSMTVNSSFLTNNNNLILEENLGCGFLFDNYSTSSGFHNMAGTFYNPGIVRVSAFLDFNSLFSIPVPGKCIVNASNIINSGTIDLSSDSLMQLSGQNVDLTRGQLTISNVAPILETSFFGTDSNLDWRPAIDLSETNVSGSLPIFYPPSIFGQTFQQFATMQPLTNFQSYFLETSNGMNNVTVRAIFIQNQNSNAAQANVYWASSPNPAVFGGGLFNVEWTGTYNDPLTGASANTYLYLNGTDYGQFTFVTTNTPENLGLSATEGFIPGLIQPSTFVTNLYSYVDAQLTGTTVSTNAGPSNPSGALSNLTGRIQINAGNTLDLSLSKISGMNFLSIAGTNQFNGAGGAQIFSPFSDINLGVTNGTMIFSNVLEPYLPNWNGTCQAWNGSWFTVTTNFSINADLTTNFYNVTNQFYVLLVNADLAPTTPAQVQNLLLHATNNLVICDALNVFGRFFTDAQNLTLTANNSGPTATDGELNLQNSINLWQTSTPNLRNLTNNGAIRLSNFEQFGADAPFSITNTTIISGTNAMFAMGQLSAVSITNVALNDSVTIGTNKYVFVYSFSKRGAGNQVKIGASIGSSLQNLYAAINGGSGAGTAYSLSTSPSRQTFATGLVTQPLTNYFSIVATTIGAAANSIITTTTSKRLTWNGNATLVGGVTAVAPSTNSTVTTFGGRYNALINNGLITDQGLAIWADNFVNSGTISNGIGSFTLSSLTAAMTNEVTNVVFTAGGDVAITSDTLVISNTFLEADRSLTLTVTNLLTDDGSASSNIWVVGTNSVGDGFNLPIKPATGDLLGTTVTIYAPVNRNVVNVWAGADLGTNAAGFINNAAIGRLVLDALGKAPYTEFTFRGVGSANAMYVDDLQLMDSATNVDNGNNFISLNIDTNMVIYYASAEMNGLSIAQKMNGKNDGRLRWIQGYTNVFNSSVKTISSQSLATSTTVDSDGDGIVNASDSTPFFTNTEMNVQVYVTNLPPLSMAIQWDSIPASTNIVTWSTNMTGPFNQILTNFVSPPTVPPVGGWPITNIIFDPISSPTRFYNVIVIPNSTQFYGS